MGLRVGAVDAEDLGAIVCAQEAGVGTYAGGCECVEGQRVGEVGGGSLTWCQSGELQDPDACQWGCLCHAGRVII